jgi:hypothetical protein
LNVTLSSNALLFRPCSENPVFGHAQKILRHLNEPRFIERIGETLGQGQTFRSVLAVFSRGYDHALEPFPDDVDKIRWTA